MDKTYNASSIKILSEDEQSKFPFQMKDLLKSKYPHKHPGFIDKGVDASYLAGDPKCTYFEDKYLACKKVDSWDDFTAIYTEQLNIHKN